MKIKRVEDFKSKSLGRTENYQVGEIPPKNHLLVGNFNFKTAIGDGLGDDMRYK